MCEKRLNVEQHCRYAANLTLKFHLLLEALSIKISRRHGKKEICHFFLHSVLVRYLYYYNKAKYLYNDLKI